MLDVYRLCLRHLAKLPKRKQLRVLGALQTYLELGDEEESEYAGPDGEALRGRALSERSRA